jgi:hypothetical protein
MNLPLRLTIWPLAACLGFLALGCAAQPRPDCKPAPENVAELVQIRPRFHRATRRVRPVPQIVTTDRA